jgi:hypothetical protein
LDAELKAAGSMNSAIGGNNSKIVIGIAFSSGFCGGVKITRPQRALKWQSGGFLSDVGPMYLGASGCADNEAAGVGRR